MYTYLQVEQETANILILVLVLILFLFHLLVVVLCRSATPEHSPAQGKSRKQQTNAVFSQRRRDEALRRLVRIFEGAG